MIDAEPAPAEPRWVNPQRSERRQEATSRTTAEEAAPPPALPPALRLPTTLSKTPRGRRAKSNYQSK